MGGCSDAKVTTMILSVDLDCCPCYRKVKKLLCKFPQVRDQVFDEKHNTITITVVCCSPEKIMDKLCEKGGKSIKGIAIKESNKATPDKPNPKPKGGDGQTKENKEKPKAGNEDIKEKEKPKGADADNEKPKSKPVDDNKDKDKIKDKEKENEKEKEKGSSGEKNTKQKDAAPVAAVAAPAAAAAQVWMAEPEARWVPAYQLGPPPQVYPVNAYYGGPPNCYDGVVVAPPCYQNQQGYGYAYGRPVCPPAYHPNRSDYFSDENPDACTIM